MINLYPDSNTRSDMSSELVVTTMAVPILVRVNNLNIFGSCSRVNAGAECSPNCFRSKFKQFELGIAANASRRTKS